MDACVKNHCYEDALEIEHYARKIYRENSSISILSQIVCYEVDITCIL
jgi:hypothetical protein